MEAVQHVNVHISFFWIVLCPLSLHVECFLPIMVGVGDDQTVEGVYNVFHLMLLSVHMRLGASVPV